MDQQTIDKLLSLSKLSLLPDDREKLLRDLSSIIGLVDFMQSIDTEGVAPLAHPLEVTQRLRPDEPDTSFDQEHYLHKFVMASIWFQGSLNESIRERNSAAFWPR